MFTLHNFSQIIVICLSVKTGRSPLELLLLITRLLLLLRLFWGELGPDCCVEAAEATEAAEAAAEVTVACRRAIPDVDARSEAVEAVESAIIGSGEPGEAGGDLTEG